MPRLREICFWRDPAFSAARALHWTSAANVSIRSNSTKHRFKPTTSKSHFLLATWPTIFRHRSISNLTTARTAVRSNWKPTPSTTSACTKSSKSSYPRSTSRISAAFLDKWYPTSAPVPSCVKTRGKPGIGKAGDRRDVSDSFRGYLNGDRAQAELFKSGTSYTDHCTPSLLPRRLDLRILQGLRRGIFGHHFVAPMVGNRVVKNLGRLRI